MASCKSVPGVQGAKKIALIGGGKMGEAIMAGLLRSSEGEQDSFSAEDFVVANPGLQRREYLQAAYGVACVEDARAVTSAPDIVILAVKPQVILDVLDSIRDNPVFGGEERGPLFVSIAAGIATKTLLRHLPKGARVVRVMPNTPLLVGAGMTAVVGDGPADFSDVDLTRSLFARLGEAVVVNESEMDAVCAVSGSGPAYVAAFVEALRAGGVEQGLSFDLAQKLALQTALGTLRLISETGQAPEEVRRAVCSPGGTTLAALDAMGAAGFASAIACGVEAATKRSIELGDHS